MNRLAFRTGAFAPGVRLSWVINSQANIRRPQCHLFLSRSAFSPRDLSIYKPSSAFTTVCDDVSKRQDNLRMNVMKDEKDISVDGSNALNEEHDPGEISGTSLRILKYPHPALRANNAEIDMSSDMEETRRIAREMLKVMYASHGVGLAAPQVGVNQQLLVFNPEGDAKAFLQEVVMVNPKVVATSKKTDVQKEACLSFPGMDGEVKRHEWVKVEGWRLNGKKFKVKLEGWKARIFQHEFDHLNGTVYIDHLDDDSRNNVRERLDELVEEYNHNPYKGMDPAL